MTSLVALETAQRLLHNYCSGPTTTALVDDLDIFIVPMVNPDGVAYSLYDNRLQRTNMNVDGCDEAATPLNAGIDTNRNFPVGSFFDDYVGSSPNCESAVYTGRSEIATEQYFFEASETILSRIKQFRGSVVWPGRTGPVVDVLYSAAGNSGDEHFYDDKLTNDPDIYGWYGILEVTRAYSLDDDAPESTNNVDGKGAYSGPVDVFFDSTELQWFSVDEAANVEGDYHPEGNSTRGLNREVIKIR